MKFDKETEKLLEGLMDLAIEDPDVPEYHKVDMRITRQVGRLKNKIVRLTQFADMKFDADEAKKCYPRKKALLEYLQLMEVGIDQFVAQMEKEGGGL